MLLGRQLSIIYSNAVNQPYNPSVLEFSRKTEPTGHVYIEIYFDSCNWGVTSPKSAAWADRLETKEEPVLQLKSKDNLETEFSPSGEVLFFL